MKVSKDAKGEVKIEKLLAVRYGDLIIPSDAEVKEAIRAIQRSTCHCY